MTTDETNKKFVYDAWNRLVQVKDSGSTLLETFSYDGLGRRVSVAVVGGNTTDLYYSSQWQVLQESVSGVPTARYVYSPGYPDELVLRDRDSDANGSLDERLYPLSDVQHNVVAVVNTSGTVVERNVYDAFGVVTIKDGSYGSRGSSSYAWTRGFQGMVFDSIAGVNFTWTRPYSPTLGRPIQNDPGGYAMGDANLQRWEGNSPTNFVDPSGLDFGDWWDPRTAIGVVYYMGEQVYDGGVALVTGEAGAALGQRAVDLYESQNGQRYTGGTGQNLSIARNIATQMIGINSMAEGIVGADMATGQTLTGMERGTRGAMGLGQFAGTASIAAGPAQTVTQGVVNSGRATLGRMVLQPAGEQLPLAFRQAFGTTTPSGTPLLTSQQLNSLLVEEYAGRVLLGQSNRSIGPATSIAQDTITGRVSSIFYNGRQVPTNLSNPMASRLGNVPRYNSTTGAGTHAEIFAVDQLLKARPGARLHELQVLTLETRFPPTLMRVKPPCPQCASLLDGVRCPK